MKREDLLKDPWVVENYGDCSHHTYIDTRFVDGVEYGEKFFIEKALKWIKENIDMYAYKYEKEDFPYDYPLNEKIHLAENFDEDFRTAMYE